MKLQLRMCEDARDGVRRDLIEAQRKVRETEEQRDGQRKENLELKRGINAEVHEKKTVVKANEELRQQVKRAEQERIVLKVRVRSMRDYVLAGTVNNIEIDKLLSKKI